MDFERIILLAGVVLVVIVSRFNRMLGGVAGLLFSGGILWWGLRVYEKGGSIGVAGKPMSKTFFLVFVAAFVLYNLFSIWTARRGKGGEGGGGSSPSSP
jgi:hypothetical protein